MDATRALEALKCGTLTNLINGFNNLHLKNNSGTKAEPENDVDNEHEEPKNDPPSTVTENEVVKEVKFEESDKEKDKLNADIESEGIIVNPLPNSNISHSIIGQKRKSETAENSPMSKNKEEEASVLPEHQEIVDPVSLTNPSTLPSTVNADDAASVSGEKVGSGGGSITSALNYLPREVDPELEIHCKTVFDRYQGVKASYGRDRVAGDPKSF